MKRKNGRAFWLWLAAVLATCGKLTACHNSGITIPLTLRPDTRGIEAVTVDSSAVAILLTTFKTALPNEVSLCLYGEVHDSLFADATVKGTHRLAHAHRAIPATEDSADYAHIWYHTRETRCRGPALIGMAHDHPQEPAWAPCGNSDPDAILLADDARMLFSLVVCPDGRGEILLQDGRRFRFRWSGDST